GGAGLARSRAIIVARQHEDALRETCGGQVLRSPQSGIAAFLHEQGGEIGLQGNPLVDTENQDRGGTSDDQQPGERGLLHSRLSLSKWASGSASGVLDTT